jgi:hypothetical protein
MYARAALMLGVVSDLELTGALSKVAFSMLRLNAADELFCYFLPRALCKSVSSWLKMKMTLAARICQQLISGGMSQKLKYKREHLIVFESMYSK